MGGSGYMKEVGNEPGMGTVNSSGAPTNQTGPTTVTAPTQSYGFGQYQTPTYAYTPQSGYSGLAQQLQQAFALSPQPYAAPRTGLMDMNPSPWSVLYGGPPRQTFADFFGQTPPQTPPGGLPGSSPTSPPPGTMPPIADPGPVTGVPGAGGTTGGVPSTGGHSGPTGTTPPASPPVPGPIGGGANKRVRPPLPPDGPGLYGDFNLLASPPGTLLNDMASAGLNTGQLGAGLLMMGSGRNAQSRMMGRPALDNQALIDASRQGVNGRDMGRTTYNRDARRWRTGDGADYVSPGNQFNTYFGKPPKG